MSAARVRVLIIDDQTLVRQGIHSLLALSDAVDVVGEAADGQAGLRAIASMRPDVVLLDLRMPVLDGLGVLAALSREADAPACLVLTTFQDDEALIAAMRLGARGFLLKDVSLDELVGTITSIAAGHSVIQPSLTDSLLRGLTGSSPSYEAAERPEPLTERELEILRLLAGGYSNKEIAAALFLSVGTVKNHVSSVLFKLGVRDRTRAVLRAYELGLIGEQR